MEDKALRLMGFARKAGHLVSGTNTCTLQMDRGRVHLLIIAEDISENGRKKIMKPVVRNNVRYVEFGEGEVLSHMTGTAGRSVFAVTDRHFAEVILQEIESGKNQRRIRE